MADVNFGQIPFEVICRFGELTKTEIITLSYFYACRNETTGQCNPSRKRISTDTGINKTHLSPALKSLYDKGWIFEDLHGNFILTIPEKVTESVTIEPPKKVTKSVTKVTESVTKVTESVTKSYGIGNSHIKELNIERNIEGTEKEHRSENPPEKRKIASRIPDNFELSDEMIFWAKARAPNVSAALETEKFKNYWQAKSGRDATKHDWQATWRNWLLNAEKWQGERNGSNQTNGRKYPNKSDEWQRTVDEYEELYNRLDAANTGAVETFN
jgi:hypothetical protein